MYQLEQSPTALLEADRAYLPSHFKRWALFRGYLSPMSLAVSVSRMQSALKLYLQRFPLL
jgi:hypothetical protein